MSACSVTVFQLINSCPTTLCFWQEILIMSLSGVHFSSSGHLSEQQMNAAHISLVFCKSIVWISCFQISIYKQLHWVLGSWEFQWYSFHSCTFSKNPNIQLMRFSLHKGRNSSTHAKDTKNAFFACFWAYVGQSLNHIGWATSIPFASINPTNPRTNPRIFHKIFLRIGYFEKLSFFLESPILEIKKK